MPRQVRVYYRALCSALRLAAVRALSGVVASHTLYGAHPHLAAGGFMAGLQKLFSIPAKQTLCVPFRCAGCFFMAGRRFIAVLLPAFGFSSYRCCRF